MDITQFDQIQIKQDPALTLTNGDTISNTVSGTINMDSSSLKAHSIKLPNGAEITNTTSTTVEVTGMDIVANHFVGNSNSYPGNTYFVSPNFADQPYLHIFSSITHALSYLTTGTIIVFEGTYNETITAKTGVSIIGVSPDKVIISSNASSVVTINGVTNFEMKNLTIESTCSVAGSNCINISSILAQSSPSIIFTNLIIRKTVNITGMVDVVLCNASSFSMNGCYVYSSAASIDGSGVNLVHLISNSGLVIDTTKFKILNSRANDSGIYAIGSTATVTLSHSQNDCAGAFINFGAIGTPVTGISFNNISKVADLGFRSILSTTNNIVDSNFSIAL